MERFKATGTATTAGAEAVKIHRAYVPVKAEGQNLHMLSAHADADEVMASLGHFDAAPKATFVIHGEPASSEALRHRIKQQLNWTCGVPDYDDLIELT